MNLKSELPTYVSFPILGAIAGPILLQVPLLGILTLLPIFPLVTIVDEIIPGDFGTTGQHVEVGFAWMFLLTWQAWLFYSSVFTLAGLALGILMHYMGIWEKAEILDLQRRTANDSEKTNV